MYLRTKADLEEKQLERSRKNIFKSGVKWFEEGEWSNKYFFNLEKARYNAKTCSRIINDAGVSLTSDEDILNEQLNYYTKLYEKDQGIHFSLINNQGIVIDQEDVQLCAQEIHEHEVFEALLTMKNGKTPGNDGLPCEFYKCFWRTISPVFMELIRRGYSDQHLPYSM